MSASLVQSSGKQVVTFSSVNPTYTLSGVTGGNTILVLVNYLDTSNNSNIPVSVSDAGGTYTPDLQINAANAPGRHNSASLYSFFNAASGIHTLTFTRGVGATNVYWVYEVLEVAGLPLTNSLDAASTTNFGASTGPVNVGGSVLTRANGFAVVMSVNQNANNPVSIYPPQIGSSGGVPVYNGLYTGTTDFPSASAGYLIPTTTAALGADFGTLATATGWGTLCGYYNPAVAGSTSNQGTSLRGCQ